MVQDALQWARGLDAGRKPRFSRWCPHTPLPKQELFLASDELEGLYGGAVGGGKSDVLLMDPLQYVDEPGFSALLIRKTFADLIKAEALIPRAQEWLTGTGATSREGGKIWDFPSGARLEFGYLDNADDHLKYQSSAFQFIGFDELTQHRMSQYLYLFSRLRRLKGSKVPLKMRATTNPGGPGHDGVHKRFVLQFEEELRGADPDDRAPRKFLQRVETDLEEFGVVVADRFFIPSSLKDNPYLDHDEYLRSLSNLAPLERERLLKGDWGIRATGENFKFEWFRVVHSAPLLQGYVRGWDPSVTVTGDPTASSLLGVKDRRVTICDQTEEQVDVPGFIDTVVRHAQADPPGTTVAIEDTGISKPMIHQLRTDERMHDVRIVPVPVGKITGPGQGNDKLARATAWINRLADGELDLLEGDWNDAFISQCLRFRNEKTDKDDRIDSVSVAFSIIYKSRGRPRVRGRTVEPGSPEFYNQWARKHARGA